MTWQIDYRKEAQAEFDKAYDYYEEQKEGLGEEFAKCVQEELDFLAMNPKIHAKVPRGTFSPVVAAPCGRNPERMPSSPCYPSVR